MAILFASNEDIDFVQLAGTLDTSPAGEGFDTNYVRSALVMTNGATDAWRHVFDDSLTDFWHQFRWRVGQPSSSGPVVTYFDPTSNQPVLRLLGSATLTLQYWDGAAWVSVNPALSLTSATHYVVTVRCKVHPTDGHFALLVGGAVQAEITGDTDFLTGLAGVKWATWGGYPFQGGNSNQNYVAEVILTTDESPVGMRVRSHTLTADGTNTDWTGTYADVDEVAVSTADVVSSDTAGQISTYALDDLPVALGASVVRAVVVTAYARRGATGPQNLQLALHTNGATYTSPTKALTTGYAAVRHVFEGNPATAEEFTAAEIDALEAGVASVT